MTTQPQDTSAQHTLLPTTRALLSNIIDYAGLFPPAQLSMKETVHKYAELLSGANSWMLGRVIVPADRLDEFDDVAGQLLPRDDDELVEPWRISATTVAADDAFLATQIERIEQFNEMHAHPDGGIAVIDLIELRAASANAIESALDVIPDALYPFFEMPVERDPRGLIASLGNIDAGAKIRTGGVKREMFPETADVARFILACAAADVPFKATAGLHQPLRHWDESIGVKQFGFLTVFLCGAFGQYCDSFDDEAAFELLEEENGKAIEFTSEHVRWRDFVLTTDELDDARLTFAVSFGSCSVDEPVETLQQMKWI